MLLFCSNGENCNCLIPDSGSYQHTPKHLHISHVFLSERSGTHRMVENDKSGTSAGFEACPQKSSQTAQISEFHIHEVLGIPSLPWCQTELDVILRQKRDCYQNPKTTLFMVNLLHQMWRFPTGTEAVGQLAKLPTRWSLMQAHGAPSPRTVQSLNFPSKWWG